MMRDIFFSIFLFFRLGLIQIQALHKLQEGDLMEEEETIHLPLFLHLKQIWIMISDLQEVTHLPTFPPLVQV
jgi:hypothetical protein